MQIKIGKGRVFVIEVRLHKDSFEYLLEKISDGISSNSAYPKIPLIKAMRKLSIENPSLFKKHGILLESHAPPFDSPCVSLRYAKDFIETHFADVI